MNDKEINIKNVSKKTLITVLISIALNPISIFFGYYIGKTLEAPKLSIQYAEVIVEIKSVLVSKTVLAPIQGNLLIRQLLDRNISFSCDDFLKDRRIDHECFNDILSGIDQTLEVFEFEKTQILPIIEKIEAWTPGNDLLVPLMVIPGLTEKPIQHYVVEDKQGTLNALKGYMNSSAERQKELIALKTDVENLESNKKKERTGKAELVVGILNSGDSDGVVSPSGKLIFGSSELIVGKENSDFSVVKAHSFANLKFKIDTELSSRKSLKKWESLLINYNQEAFEVSIESPSSSLKGSGRLPE